MPPVEAILAENEQLKVKLTDREAQLSDKESRIAELEAQIAWLRRQIFSGSKSEKIDPAQLELMLKGLQEQKAALDTQKEPIRPPEGHTHWTLRLLAGKVVELGFAKSISPETVRQILKKTNSNPGGKSNGAFPR